ncbi:hypothetical protein ACWEPH_18465 [Nocardia beijingensis]
MPLAAEHLRESGFRDIGQPLGFGNVGSRPGVVIREHCFRGLPYGSTGLLIVEGSVDRNRLAVRGRYVGFIGLLRVIAVRDWIALPSRFGGRGTRVPAARGVRLAGVRVVTARSMQLEPGRFAVLVHGGPVGIRQHGDELAAAPALGVRVRHAGALRDEIAVVGDRESGSAGVAGIGRRGDDRDPALRPPQRIRHHLGKQQFRGVDLLFAEPGQLLRQRPHPSPGSGGAADPLTFLTDRAARFVVLAYDELFAYQWR